MCPCGETLPQSAVFEQRETSSRLCLRFRNIICEAKHQPTGIFIAQVIPKMGFNSGIASNRFWVA
jgi:hypothetical protein